MRLSILVGAYSALFGPVSSRANEFARPQSIQDLQSASTTAEQALHVDGARVAWADCGAIRRDFAELKGWTDEQIHSWLIENFAYVGSDQIELNGIRNSPIPLHPHDKKNAFRPPQWKRSALLEAKLPNGRVIGLVDVKGIGHGARSYGEVEKQVRNAREKPQELDALRIRDHSDGLMSLGEAIAETTRQQAAQKLFEMSGKPLETVETYAIIQLPFEILKNYGQKIPAALYLRQAHQGRRSSMQVPPSIYIDEHGGRQMTNTGTAVDFGGVIIQDPRLKQNFESLGNNKDPQSSKPWAWGHETAVAVAHEGKHEALEAHLHRMLDPISADYEASPERLEHAKQAQKTEAWVLEQRLAGRPFSEIVLALDPLHSQQRPLQAHAQLDENITNRIAALQMLHERPEPEAKELLAMLLGKFLNHDDIDVRIAAASMLKVVQDPALLPDLEAGLEKSRFHFLRKNAEKAAIEPLGSWKDSNSFALIKKYSENSQADRRALAASALALRTEPQATSILVELAKDSSIDVRISVLNALSVKPDPVSFAAIRQGLSDVNASVRKSAVSALLVRKEPEALENALTLAHDPDPSVRSTLAEQIAQNSEPISLEILKALLKDPVESVQLAAHRSLIQRTEPESLELIYELLSDKKLRLDNFKVFSEFYKRKDETASRVARKILENPSIKKDPHQHFQLLQLSDRHPSSTPDCLKRVLQSFHGE